MKEEMEKLGLFEQYQTELDFIAVRHFFYRFWKLLTNYETDQKELKLQLINELFDYMESNIPDWENNHYVRYSLPPHIGRLLCLYGSRQEMISFIVACNGSTGKKLPPSFMALPIPEVLLLIRSRFFWKLAVEKKFLPGY